MLAPRVITLALGMLVGAGTARAQAPNPAPDYEAAKRHYQTAEEASARGDHAVAAREYGTAYDITKDPILFFKIAQSHDKAGDCRTAVSYYERYLKEANPTPDYRQRTEALLAACRSRVSETSEGGSGATTVPPAQPPVSPVSPAEPPVSPAPPAQPVAQPPSRDGELVGAPTFEDEQPSWQRTAAWTSVGVALALGTTAAVLGLSAASREEDIDNLISFRDVDGQPASFTGTTRDRYLDLVDEGKRLENLAIAAVAATGAAAAAAVVFFMLDGRRAEGSAAVAPSVTGDGAGLTWGGRF